MSSPEDIDKLFKEKLKNSGSQEIPASFLEDINKRLDDLDATIEKEDNITKKGRKKVKVKTGVWTFLLSIVGISLGVYILTGNENAEEKQINREDLIIDSNNSAENIEQQPEGEAEKLPLNLNGNLISEDEKKIPTSISSGNNKTETMNVHNVTNEASDEKVGAGNAINDVAKKNDRNLSSTPDSKPKKADKSHYLTDSTTKKVTKKITDENGDSTTTTVITTVITTTTTKKIPKADSIQTEGEVNVTNAKDSAVVGDQLKKKSPN